MMLTAGLIAARFVHFVTLLALFGGTLFPRYACERGGRASYRMVEWLRGFALAAALLALASGIAWFLFTAASMADDLASAGDPQVLASVIQATTFGPLWLARLALLLVAAALILFRPRSARLGWIVPALAALALMSLAGTGHAEVPGGWQGALHAAADAAHLLSAGVWLGALWPLGMALARNGGSRGVDDFAVGRLLARFSGVGLLAVVALVASGLVNAWYLVGSANRLLTTTYGRMLMVKIALFLTMAALAAANRYWIMPAFASARSAGDPRWLDRIRRHVLFEQLLGLCIVGAVSVLGILPTASEA
ncbi:MAG: copper homeostasis membrane protein CopD [Caulobacteraceae bacterium]